MTDPLSRQRVQRLRQTRKERGFRETNVWLTKEVDQQIDDAVARGAFSLSTCRDHPCPRNILRTGENTVT